MQTIFKKLIRGLEKPLFVYLFGLFFLLHKTSQYFPSFEWITFLVFFLVYCTISYLIVSILKKTKLIKFRFIVLTVVWFFLLFTNDIRALNQFYILLILLLVSAILFIRSNISTRLISLSNKLTNFFIFSLILFTIFNGISINNSENKYYENLQNKKVNFSPLKNKQDIIWILLDEYAAPASLRTQFHFKDELIDSLHKRNFFVFDSLPSRYDVTIWSINSIFNCDDSIAATNFMFAAKYLNESKWVSQLQNQGYTYNNFDFLAIAGSRGISHVSNYFFPSKYLQQILNNTFFIGAWYYLAEPKEKMIDVYNQQIIQESLAKLKEKRNEPQFTWIHLLIPHPPYYKDANGNINKNPVINPTRASREEANNQYIDFLQYGNKVTLNILNQIPDWQHKTIIISGDHGARMFLPSGDPHRFATFAAIYYPGMDTAELKQIKFLQQIPFHLH